MRPCCFILLGLLLAGARTLAEDPLHETSGTNVLKITPAFLNQLAEELRTNHPALRSARARVNSAEASVGGVRTWEDPMLRLGGMGARRDMRAENGDVIYGVEQKLPLFGKPQLARKVAQAGLATEEATLDYQFQSLRVELSKALFRAALAEQTTSIDAQDVAWLEALTARVEQQYSSGQSSQTDLLKAQNARSKRRDQWVTDGNQLRHERLTLNRMLGRNLHAPWPALDLPPILKPIEYNERLVNYALKFEPKLKMMRQEIERNKSAVQLTRRQRLPDINAGLEGRTFTGDGSFRSGTLMLSMNFPWANARQYRSDIHRDEEKLEAATFELADYELKIREDVHHLTLSVDAARREALLYQNELIPRAEQALANLRAAWESGRGLFNDVLEARRMVLEARLMAARAVTAHYSALAELVLCCGAGSFEALEMIGATPDPVSFPPDRP